jgi:eukaryotic-like serine/threonine-protein kinase
MNSSGPYEDRHISNVAAALNRFRVPERLGPYHVIELLGEGGMGMVYKAEQRTPIHRTLAVKVSRFDLDSDSIVRRFQAERETLATLDHTNIARVIDAGSTDHGKPYIALEFVEGSPITEFANENKLGVVDRLKIMLQVCEAVQHAHQKGIVHRDLKPSNILVSPGPVAKVIDFGVARILDPSLRRTMFTEDGQRMGTLEYMSPEQADGQSDIDTRSDVYSLGVVLYELLTGSLPIDSDRLRSHGYARASRLMQDAEIPRPSTRLSGRDEQTTSAASDRNTTVDGLQKLLRQELDWLVLKALKKDREERYASPRELAQDIENYLEHKPLIAGPESRVYRASKFVRRNRLVVSSAVVVLCSLLAGLAMTLWSTHQARQSLRRAETESANAQAALRFLADDILSASNPDRTLGKSVTVVESLNIASANLHEKFKDRPKVESSLAQAIASAYLELGEEARAEKFARRAVELNEFVDDLDQRLRNDETLAEVLRRSGDLDGAIAAFRRIYDLRRATFGFADEMTLRVATGLASVLSLAGRDEESLAIWKEVYDQARTMTDEGDPQWISILNSYGSRLEKSRRDGSGLALVLEANRLAGQHLHADHPVTIVAVESAGVLLADTGDLQAAEPYLLRVLDARTRVEGPTHLQTFNAERNYIALLGSIKRTDEALSRAARLYPIVESTLGLHHPATHGLREEWIGVLQGAARMPEAEEKARWSLEIVQADPNRDETRLMKSIGMLFSSLRRQDDKLDQAAPLGMKLVDMRRRLTGPAHPDTINAVRRVAQVLARLDRWGDVLVLTAPTVELLDASQPLDDFAREVVDLNSKAKQLASPDK